MTTNRLQAVLDQAARQSSPPKPAPMTEAPRPPRRAAVPKSLEGKGRTILVGAHLPPQYNKQLRLLAAEEECQVNTLIREALDLLFVKKGKGKLS